MQKTNYARVAILAALGAASHTAHEASEVHDMALTALQAMGQGHNIAAVKAVKKLLPALHTELTTEAMQKLARRLFAAL